MVVFNIRPFSDLRQIVGTGSRLCAMMKMASGCFCHTAFIAMTNRLLKQLSTLLKKFGKAGGGISSTIEAEEFENKKN
jgi:hypothetical protein